MLSIVISIASTEAEEGQDRQNHNDETDEINQSVHKFSPSIAPFTQVTIYRHSSRPPGKTCTLGSFLHCVARGSKGSCHAQQLELNQLASVGVLDRLGMSLPDEKPIPSKDEAEPPAERDFRRMLEDYANDLRMLMAQIRRKLH
jgi:hypothetical protein